MPSRTTTSGKASADVPSSTAKSDDDISFSDNKPSPAKRPANNDHNKTPPKAAEDHHPTRQLLHVQPTVDLLRNLLDAGVTSGILHVTGLPHGGKYSVVSAALTAAQNCLLVEVNGSAVGGAVQPKLFFGEVLTGLRGVVSGEAGEEDGGSEDEDDSREGSMEVNGKGGKGSKNGDSGAMKAVPPPANLAGFVARFKDLLAQLDTMLQNCDLPSQHLNLVLVIRRAERLRHFGPNFWAALAKLDELAGSQLCHVTVLTISCLPFSKFMQGTGVMPVLEIAIPGYSKDETKEIIVGKARNKIAPRGNEGDSGRYELFKKYTSLMIDVYWKATTDLVELSYLVFAHWPQFQRPLDADPDLDPAESLRKLWKHFEETSAQASAQLLVRDASYLTSSNSGLSTQALDVNRDREVMELPLFTKYLLIAGFLASHNPPKSDKRFFVKFQAKARKMAKPAKMDLEFQRTYNTLGPRLWGLGRLRAIFFALIEDRIVSSTRVDMQMRQLEQLNLFVRTRSADPISGLKFKCTAAGGFVRKLADNLQFDLDAHLFKP